MAKRPAEKKQPDHQQFARKVLDAASPDAEAPPKADGGKPAKNPAAVELGRLGGLKGGKARAEKLSQKQRTAIARRAARARWSNSEDTADGS
jgi:hypothetical protein